MLQGQGSVRAAVGAARASPRDLRMHRARRAGAEPPGRGPRKKRPEKGVGAFDALPVRVYGS
ncbi:hypothetical protein GCM10010387_00810 [Streptomyces inusitatus]|uniref:Uncharacterized protein n=1 Tax=Streptomyces inusitatus TaxID=68221 RepID=A0A918PJ54_9ACTN|nr:hypothetical protein GCM10010387_00810 [Streptomyces inusitatus]